MNQKIWVASDLHLGHLSLTFKDRKDQYPVRRKGYERRILDMWEQCVMPNDVVLLLGDVAIGRVKPWFEKIKALPGRKVLCMGDLEKNEPRWYQRYVDKVIPVGSWLTLGEGHSLAEIGHVLLSYLPAFPSVFTDSPTYLVKQSYEIERGFVGSSCIANLHGHTRARGCEDHRTFDCGIDTVGEQLKTLDQLVDLWMRKQSY